MARNILVFLVVGTVIFFFYTVSSADVPDSINYQGKLTTATGGCLNDTVQMTFTIYADAFGTVSDWSETQTQVVVKEGIFNVLLGSVNPLPASIFDGTAKYLGVQVESDPEMSPLKPMVTTLYSFHCGTADSALNVPAAGIVSVDGVSNPGGDVDLIQTNAITITPNDGANTITFGETHSARSDNPHSVTAAQTGALVSVDGVSNAGGDVDFVAGSNMTITPNDAANTITFSSTASGIGGSGTTNYIPKFTAPTTLGNSAIYQSGSDIGIGTPSPSQKLGIGGNVALEGGGASQSYALDFRDTEGSEWQVQYLEGGLNFWEAGIGSRMLIEDGGQVGIGTTSPDYKLHVDGNFYATTVNTGQGNNELYAMNQNVRTSDNPTFNRVGLTDYGTALGGFHVGGTSDPGTDNLVVDGNVTVGNRFTSVGTTDKVTNLNADMLDDKHATDFLPSSLAPLSWMPPQPDVLDFSSTSWTDFGEEFSFYFMYNSGYRKARVSGLLYRMSGSGIVYLRLKNVSTGSTICEASITTGAGWPYLCVSSLGNIPSGTAKCRLQVRVSSGSGRIKKAFVVLQ
jgi:hypothetical protein